MDVLYLSDLCSKAEHERMFRLYGTVISHASQKFHGSVVQGLSENGVNVTALSFRAIARPQADDLVKEPDTTEYATIHYLPHHKHARLNRIYTISKTARFIRAWKKEHKQGVICSDIINGEFSIALFLVSLFRRNIKKIGIVTDVPSCRANETRKGLRAIPIRIKNRLIQQFDGYLFLTRQMDALLNPKHKPFAVMEGVVDETAKAYANRLEDKTPERVCMMAGLLEKDFGVEALLEAFERLEMPDLRLHFYGKGRSVAAIEECAKRDSRIRYFGEVLNTQILEEERKATLLINPRPPIGEWTKYSFPSKNIEYIASGTPMVAYELEGMPAEYPEHFYTIQNNDIEHTLRTVLGQSREELHAFGASAREWILTYKCPKKQTECVAELIETIISKR